MPTYVELPAPADLISDRAGNIQRGATATVVLRDTLTAATHSATDGDGSDTATGGLIVRGDGSIGTATGRRYFQHGVPVDVTVSGRTRGVEPWSAAAVESGGVSPSELAVVQADVDAAAADAALKSNKTALPYALLDTGLFSGTNIDAALTQAKTDLGSNGGRIIIPAGSWVTASPPSFADTRNVILEGAGGENAGGVSPTRLTYTGTAARAIDARSSYGFGIRDLQLLYSNASFSGILVDLSHSGGATDSAFSCIEKCYLGGAGISTAACLVSLSNAISLVIRDCNLSQAVLGIKGRNSSGEYSNAINIDNCKFHLLTTAAISAAGQAWRIVGCTFEQLASGAAGAYTPGSGGGSTGVTFEGCWFGDANTSGTWIQGGGSGWAIKGCYIATGAVGIALGGSSFGADISNNQFDGPTTSIAVAGSCCGIVITANHFKVATTAITVAASCNGITIIGNQFAASMDSVVLDTGVVNCLILGNNMLPATSDVTYSGGGTMPTGLVQRRAAHSMHLLGLQEHTTAVADAQFPATPPNGTIAVENVGGVRKICVRLTGVWYKATLT